jgi:hypothetical protein
MQTAIATNTSPLPSILLPSPSNPEGKQRSNGGWATPLHHDFISMMKETLLEDNKSASGPQRRIQ